MFLGEKARRYFIATVSMLRVGRFGGELTTFLTNIVERVGINYKDANGNTLLHHLCEINHERAAHWLCFTYRDTIQIRPQNNEGQVPAELVTHGSKSDFAMSMLAGYTGNSFDHINEIPTAEITMQKTNTQYCHSSITGDNQELSHLNSLAHYVCCHYSIQPDFYKKTSAAMLAAGDNELELQLDEAETVLRYICERHIDETGKQYTARKRIHLIKHFLENDSYCLKDILVKNGMEQKRQLQKYNSIPVFKKR